MKLFRTTLFALLFAFSSLAHAGTPVFTSDFGLDQCTFASSGRNPYFVLVPGFQLTYEGVEDGAAIRLVITVQNQTRMVQGIETRIVEERETNMDSGQLTEVSRNYFAICKKNNSVFYFGESVDTYENGKIVNHDGSWQAGVNGANAGLQMPGLVLLGSRHFQEIAPDVAEDRAEIVSQTETVTTPAGIFHNCVKVKETSAIEPGPAEFKFYSRGIGGVQLGTLKLVEISDPAKR